MSRRYSDLDDLIHDLDSKESWADDPFGVPEFDDEDLSILGALSPDRPRAPRPAKPAPRKRGRPKKKPA